uniref:Uncharacterized protein n=1 Tax=Tanacetum cinerariifolium TaxID=118510 RepID=A0A6L2NKF4_TANCI|nr:hypothetical protein [Tanacetum cinerariifolium]
MYTEVFGIAVPLIQSPPTESTQGTHRTPSAPRSPTPKVDATPVLTIDKADELILQDTLQVSLAEHKSRQEQEDRENVALVDKNLAFEEIEKMVEGQDHVVNDSSIPKNDEHNVPDNKLEPRSDKESLEVGITDVIVHVNVYDGEEEEDEITDEELHRRYGYLFEHFRAKFMPRKSFVTLAHHLHEAMADSLPTMVDNHIKEKVEKQVLEQVRNQASVYVAKGDNEQEQRLSTSGKQEQADDNDFWIDSYASDDDEIPTKKMSQDIMEEVSRNVDEAKLKKIADKMLRQRCTSGDEHQYHIDHMKNFLKIDIVWESRKEIHVSPHPIKTTPLVLSC